MPQSASPLLIWLLLVAVALPVTSAVEEVVQVASEQVHWHFLQVLIQSLLVLAALQLPALALILFFQLLQLQVAETVADKVQLQEVVDQVEEAAGLTLRLVRG
jgi:hypothetical protein